MTLHLPYPKDDPATISALGTRLTAQADVLRGAQHALRTIGVREPLTEVDRSRPSREFGDLGEDRRSERAQSGGESRSTHACAA